MNNADGLLFRRQFIMGTERVKKISGWVENTVGDQFFLYCHPELEVHCIQKEEKEVHILGFILDPYNPQFTNEAILEEIILNNDSFEAVLEYTGKYGGRWALIWKDQYGVKIMNDACGARQVFFYKGEQGIWCGSQPSIIAYELGLRVDCDPELTDFTASKEYKNNKYEWYGSGTIYENIEHMLPNHYLDMNSCKIKRFWPAAELEELQMAEAAAEASRILEGTLKAVTGRFHKVMLSVTAGNDSRMVLAASKNVKDRIRYFFCMDDSNKKGVDYKVSSRLLADLGLKQDILRAAPVDDEFLKIYNQNVMPASDLPGKRFIYTFYKELPDYIHVSGVCGEIARNYYYYNYDRGVSAEELISVSGYKGVKYMEKSISRWLEDAGSAKNLKTINLYDLYYWENLCGGWGAKSAAEQDIAIEELWPYNNRRLMQVMLSVSSRYRKPPFFKLQRAIIRNLWKETLTRPINPNIIKKACWLIRNSTSKAVHTLRKLGGKTPAAA